MYWEKGFAFKILYDLWSIFYFDEARNRRLLTEHKVLDLWTKIWVIISYGQVTALNNIYCPLL